MFLFGTNRETTTNVQLRDDLMTMLVAGHETTAAVLTWVLFCLAQKPEQLKLIQDEIDTVLGDRNRPAYEDLAKLQYVRFAVAESLRLYPEPPIIIRLSLIHI